MVKRESIEVGIRSKAFFTVLSTMRDLEELLAVSGMRPDVTWQRGDLISPDTSRRTRHEFSGFTINSRASERDSIDAHLNSLLDMIRPTFSDMQNLIGHINEQESTHYPARFWVHDWRNRPSFDSDVSPTTIQTIGELGAWLAISFRYFPEL